jgi:hypothetical protein
MGRTARRSPDPGDSNPSRPGSPSQPSPIRMGTGATHRSPSNCRTAGAVPSTMSLSRVDLLRIIVVRVVPILVLAEEFGQRARFTLLLS